MTDLGTLPGDSASVARAYLTLLVFRRVYGFADNVVVDLFGRLGLCRFCRGRWRSRWRCLWLYWRTSRHWWCRRLIAQWHYRWRNPSLGWGDRRRGGRRDGKRLRRRLRDSLPHPNRLHSDRGRPSTRPMIQQNKHNPRQTKPQNRAKQSRNVQITLAKVQRGLRVSAYDLRHKGQEQIVGEGNEQFPYSLGQDHGSHE